MPDPHPALRGSPAEARDPKADALAAALLADPRVDAVRVCRETDDAGAGTLTAFIVPDPGWLGARRDAMLGEETATKLAQWSHVFNRTYSRSDAARRAPSFAGWISSFTGAAIPADEMTTWQDHTVERIRAAAPADILEVGCGVGLILEKLAPGCSSYYACDISRDALQTLQNLVGDRPDLSHVHLAQRGAHELRDLPTEFDIVIVNSVLQYFPDFQYLLRVLSDFGALLKPDGHVFLGDVRDVRLLPAFNAAVALARASGLDDVGSVRRSLRSRMEQELAVDPGAFANLPGYGSARLMLKESGGDNEMTRYRFDVMLSRPRPVPGADAAIAARAWEERGGLAQVPPRVGAAPVLLTGIPNRRLALDVAAAALLQDLSNAVTVARLGEQAAARVQAGPPCWDPVELVTLGRRRGHRAEALCSARPDRFDLLLSDPALPAPAPPAEPNTHVAPPTDPILSGLAEPLVEELEDRIARPIAGTDHVLIIPVAALPPF